MPRKDRTVLIKLGKGARVVYARSSSHPIEYAITLRVLHEGAWHTIYLVDNAHSHEEHHAHAYVGDSKQPPAVFSGEVNTVMNDAIRTFSIFWQEIYDAWRQAR